jgi:NitT/TauT family transport system substrate-binding protein
MRRLLLASLLLFGIETADADTVVKVGWAAPVVSAAAAPFAIAMRMGWYHDAGLDVRVLPMPGSIDVVKQVATGDLMFGFPSIEPELILRPQGVKAKQFYTGFQGNVYGMAVPADSPIKDFADLRGKSIGVTSMGSAGVVMARALVADAGLDPQKDVRIIAVGEAGQAAAMVRSKQIDSLSQFDTAYAMIEQAGVKLRFLDKSKIEHFPSNGLFALETTLAGHRAEAVALAQGMAKGTIFMLANPKAAVAMYYEAFPQAKPTGLNEEEAQAAGLRQLMSVIHVFPLAQSNVTRWGEFSMPNYDAYIDFLVKWGVAKEKVPASDLVTNDLIPDINAFDAAAIEAQAKAWTPHR